MPRRLASIRSTDLEVSIFRETRNCPATGISSAAFLPVSRRRRKPLTLVLVQFATVPRLFRRPPSQRNARFRVSRKMVQTGVHVNCSEAVRVTRYSCRCPALLSRMFILFVYFDSRRISKGDERMCIKLLFFRILSLFNSKSYRYINRAFFYSP